MSEGEFVTKTLRSVLMSSKEGVLLTRLEFEYKSLCGEAIPVKKLGYSNLVDFLKSIPSVVHLDYRMGELRCFSVACEATAHIKELVARQKSSKKAGRSQLVNCRMRFKPSNPYMLNVRPRSSLRQPSTPSTPNLSPNWSRSHGGFRSSSAPGDYRTRQFDQKFGFATPVEHRQPRSKCSVKQSFTPDSGKENLSWPTNTSPEGVPNSSNFMSGVYDIVQVQSRISKLLKMYTTGLWLSKLPDIYSNMFGQELPSHVLTDMLKWTDICMVERCPSTNRVEWMIFPPLPAKPQMLPFKTTGNSPPIFPHNSLKDNHGLQSFATENNKNDQPQSSTVTPPESVNTSLHPNCDGLTHPNITGVPPSPISAPVPDPQLPSVISADLRHKLEELLSKYSVGLWAHALPKLFMETYKIPFPEHVLNNLPLLVDICSVEYPFPHDKSKAILYKAIIAEMENTDNQECRSHPLPSGLEVLSPIVPSKLVPPPEQYPSVLVTEAKSSNAVTIRYVGKNYSNAQQAMEDMMHSFYSQSSSQNTQSNISVGQLVAVRGEDAEELARAQVIEVTGPNKFKVYYMDYGFSVETSETNLLELHQDFVSLPFQATNVSLADLEAFSTHPSVLSSLDKLAVGKILLMETLETCQQNKTPHVVLYDTSLDEDININSSCLKSLQDHTMNNPLNVNVTYKDVCVTNICADGIIHCQLQSRGIARLRKLLEATEAYFTSQMTTEFLVSTPFTGKFCLMRHNGKWARVEITNMYGNRVIEILFVDMGLTATVEVTDLREIPALFLKDISIIPPQVIKCRMADLTVPEGGWSPKAVLWLKEAVQGAQNCKMKILKVDQHKGDKLVSMHLFTAVDGEDLQKSINHQLTKSKLWQKLTAQNDTMSSKRMDTGDASTLRSPVLTHAQDASTQRTQIEVTTSKNETSPLSLPPPLEIPQQGQNLDVYVPVACHPGYFVLQRWDDLHKLVVLTGEMMLYYNQMDKTNMAISFQKGEIYAAKVDKNWYRVQVKGILANGFVSVYELDYGKHELVRSTAIQPLIEEFRQLSFQAMTAQLAGVSQHPWSEEASMLFRSHIEKRPLVAQLDSVQDVSEVKGDPWERRMTVYLVDTMEDKDIWIHTIMADIDG